MTLQAFLVSSRVQIQTPVQEDKRSQGSWKRVIRTSVVYCRADAVKEREKIISPFACEFPLSPLPVSAQCSTSLLPLQSVTGNLSWRLSRVMQACAAERSVWRWILRKLIKRFVSELIQHLIDRLDHESRKCCSASLEFSTFEFQGSLGCCFWQDGAGGKSQGKICRVEKCSVKGPAVDWNDLRFRPLFTRRVQRSDDRWDPSVAHRACSFRRAPTVNNSDQSLQLTATLMLHSSEGQVPIVLSGLFYISGKNPIYCPHQVWRHVSRRWLRNGSINQSVKGSVYSTPWDLRQLSFEDFSQFRTLDRTLITRMTVWDCVTRRCDPRLAVNSGQARLSPLGFLAPALGGLGQGPAWPVSAWCWVSHREVTASSLSHGTAASLLHGPTRGRPLKKETCSVRPSALFQGPAPQAFISVPLHELKKKL